MKQTKLLMGIDTILDKITMYRLLLYYLLMLLAAAMVLSYLGYLSYNPATIAFSAAYLCALCWITNKVFAYVYEVPTNSESSLLTALILSLIITPLATPNNLIFLSAAGGLAIASKYLLTINKQHIFNPAAVAVALTALGAGQSASWWVGSTPLLAFVVVGGLLVVRKIRRFQMVMSFLAVALGATLAYSVIGHSGSLAELQSTVLHSSLFFMAFVMLTEPATSPATATKQRWYGVLAGLLFPPQVHIGRLYSTPELVLVVSNVFSYIMSPKVKLLPKLVERIQQAPDVMDFVFTPGRQFSFKSGQYMEWTLPHSQTDSRGSRRYFTLASSPTEKNLQLGVKFYNQGSSFKKAMLAMNRDTPIAAGQLSGDFVLPDDPKEKLAFIAGGIGITPYRSMIKYLLDTQDARSVTLLYSERNAGELAYTDVFEAARAQLGTKVVYALTDKTPPTSSRFHHGFISAEMITSEIPDYLERRFYISGPHSMVTAMTTILSDLEVPSSHIKIDFFPGYS